MRLIYFYTVCLSACSYQNNRNVELLRANKHYEQQQALWSCRFFPPKRALYIKEFLILVFLCKLLWSFHLYFSFHTYFLKGLKPVAGDQSFHETVKFAFLSNKVYSQLSRGRLRTKAQDTPSAPQDVCEFDLSQLVLLLLLGVCVNGIGQYSCICQEGWFGTNCQDDGDQCASGPCLNNATCIDGIMSYTCDCVPGFNGVSSNLFIFFYT